MKKQAQFQRVVKFINRKENSLTKSNSYLFFSGTPKKVDDCPKDEIDYETDTETGFVSEDGYFGYFTLAGGTYSSICNSSFLELNGVEGYKDGTLGFSTRDDVLEQVKDLMQDRFIIAPEDWFVRELYAVKKETVDLYKDSVYQEANKPVTSSNELEQAKWVERAKKLKNIPSEDYYYISLGFKIDDIPSYLGGGFYYGQDESYMIMGYMAEVVYTRNGIEFIAFGNVNETDFSSAEDVDIITPDEAKALIQDKYDRIIFDGDIEIYDMQFVYLPIPQNDLGAYFLNFEVRPFYAFYCKQTENFNGEVISSSHISYFDAVTGKEFGTEPI